MAAADIPSGARRLIFRHSVVVRITHWINVLCLTVLLMSGLQIFNAHPALYWGDRSDFARPLMSMTSRQNGAASPSGITTIFGHAFDTTGLFGVSRDDGELNEVGFPSWITVPSGRDLALGRRWHFFFAWLFVLNGLVYLAYTLLSRHLRRDLLPTGPEMRALPLSLRDHLRLRFPKGEEARHYNVLQKLTYLIVIFVLLPLAVLAGLTMSPGLDTAFPELLTLFGGRQSARTVHFIAAFAIVTFVVVHVVMVILSGIWNNLRAMVTGRYSIGGK